MAIDVGELKSYLNIDADNSDHDEWLTYLLEAAKEDLVVATGKKFDEDDALMRMFVLLYAKREFDMLSDSAVDNRLLDIQKKILLSVRFAEEA